MGNTDSSSLIAGMVKCGEKAHIYDQVVYPFGCPYCFGQLAEPVTEAEEELEILDAEDDSFETEGEFSFRKIWQMLSAEADLILTMSEEDIPALRKGLTGVKSRDNEKRVSEGKQKDDRIIYFNMLGHARTAEGKDTEDVRVQIQLRQRVGVKIKAIQITDKGL